MFNPIFFSGIKSSALLTNLVAYYTLNSITSDSTGLSPTGTATGVDYVSGISGNAARFNATGDRVTIADNTNFSFTTGLGNDIPFSMSMWVYFTGFSSAFNFIINKRANTGGNDEWQLIRSNSDGNLYFYKFDRTNPAIHQTIRTSSAPFSLNTWYFITITDDGTKTVAGMKMYINGTLQTVSSAGTGSYTGMPNGTSGTTIGISNWDFANSTLQHLGYVEEVAIWRNRALTQTEITYLYNSGTGRTYPL